MKKAENRRLEDVNIFEEFNHLRVGSKRITRRLIKTVTTLYKKPGMAISAASKNPAEAKAIYRLFGNKKLKKEDILEVHRNAVIEKVKEKDLKIILCPQDTSDLNFTRTKSDQRNRKYRKFEQ